MPWHCELWIRGNLRVFTGPINGSPVAQTTGREPVLTALLVGRCRRRRDIPTDRPCYNSNWTRSPTGAVTISTDGSWSPMTSSRSLAPPPGARPPVSAAGTPVQRSPPPSSPALHLERKVASRMISVGSVVTALSGCFGCSGERHRLRGVASGREDRRHL